MDQEKGGMPYWAVATPSEVFAVDLKYDDAVALLNERKDETGIGIISSDAARYQMEKRGRNLKIAIGLPVQTRASDGSIGRVKSQHPTVSGFFYVEWVYGRDTSNNVVSYTGGIQASHLIVITEEEYVARRDRKFNGTNGADKHTQHTSNPGHASGNSEDQTEGPKQAG